MILIVDDDFSVRKSISRLLKSHGHVVAVASDAQTAIELAEQHKPRLILLDQLMPGMSGLELLRHLKTDPRLSAIPVAMLSADLNLAQRDEAQRLGAVACISKYGTDSSYLSRVVESATRGSQPTQRLG